MRFLTFSFVLLSLPFWSSVSAASCDTSEDCSRCLAEAFGQCLSRGLDPICESRKKACQIAPLPGPSRVAPEFNVTPARAYMRGSDIPPPSIGGYGVVALRARATDANRRRLLMTCVAFTTHLPQQYRLPYWIPLSYQMITIWPLDNPAAIEAMQDDCAYVIQHYDLYGGLSAIQDAQLQGAKLSGPGPFLIGWSPSSARGVPNKVVLVVDLSAFESQDSFDQAFVLWQERIIENPNLWRGGFSIEGTRLAVRDFVDRYGQDVIKFWGAGH